MIHKKKNIPFHSFFHNVNLQEKVGIGGNVSHLATTKVGFKAGAPPGAWC